MPKPKPKPDPNPNPNPNSNSNHNPDPNPNPNPDPNPNPNPNPYPCQVTAGDARAFANFSRALSRLVAHVTTSACLETKDCTDQVEAG